MLGAPPVAQQQSSGGDVELATKASTISKTTSDKNPAKALPKKKLCIIALVLAGALGLGLGLGLGLSSSSSSSSGTVVKMGFVVQGDVSDFTPTVKGELTTKVATVVGVDASAVTLTVTSASVKLEFAIELPDEGAATAAVSTLAAKVADESAASSFLSTASMTIVVESILVAPAVVDSSASPSPPPPPPSPAPAGPPPSSPLGGEYDLPRTITIVAATGDGSRRRLSAPTSGDYAADSAVENTQDQVTSIMNTPNLILCMMRAISFNQMVNKGRYLGLSRDSVCDPWANPKSKAYTANSVEVTMAGPSEPLYMKGIVKQLRADGGTYYVHHHTEMTEGTSAANPNGLFAMEYTIHTAAGLKVTRGQLKSTTAGISWTETGYGGGGTAKTDAVVSKNTAGGGATGAAYLAEPSPTSVAFRARHA